MSASQPEPGRLLERDMTTWYHPGRVLVGLDGSAYDEIALDLAAFEARVRNLPMHLVHVLEVPHAFRADPHLDQRIVDRVTGTAETMLRSAVRRAAELAPGLAVSHEVVVGQVVPALLDRAAAASLVVLGSGERFDRRRMFLGSVAVHVSAHAPCPVLVARRGEPGEAVTGPGEGRVVVGVDGSAISADAVGFAFAEASYRGCGLVAVHAWDVEVGYDPWVPVVPHVDRVAADAELVLSETLAGWREKYPDVPVVPRLVRGSPAHALLTESAGAQLLVLGSHGRGRFAGMLLGSVTQALLRHAPTSLAIVRPARPSR